MSLSLSDFIYHFHNGSSTHAFEHMGCHPEMRDGENGFVFRVWAPNAQKVSVVGDFNFWNEDDLPMEKISGGIWEAWTSNAQLGQAYKFLVVGAKGQSVHKVDPYAYRTQLVPDTSSVIWQQDNYTWNDKTWFARNGKKDPLKSPMNIYEFHMGSWKRKPDGSRYTYAEVAPLLADYVKETGNHVLYRVIPVFEGNNQVASGVTMEAWSVEDDGEGICFYVYVYNVQPGVEIDYATGESRLAAAISEADEITAVYVVNTASGKFHSADCGQAQSIKPENQETFDTTRSQMIVWNFAPAGCCNP